METIPTKSKPFLLMNMPLLPFFRIMNEMDTIDQILISESLCERLKQHVKVGKCSITLLPGYSRLDIGSFSWHFNTSKYGFEGELAQRTIGPLTQNIKRDEGGRWYTETDDHVTPVYKLVQYLLRNFPKMKLEFFQYHTKVKEDTLQMISSLDYSTCSESKLIVPEKSDQPIKEYFDGLCKNRQLVTMSTDKRGKYKTLHLKNFHRRDVPVDPACWFDVITAPLAPYQIVLFSDIKLTNEHFQKIIQEWVELKMESLVLVRAKNVKEIDMATILVDFIHEEWDDEIMEEYREDTELSEYFNHKGTILWNSEGKVATVKWDESEETFYFLVWDHTAPPHVFTFFANLPV